MMSQPIRSRAIPRRNVVAGMAALGLCGLARGSAGAQGAASQEAAGRPLAERLAAYADALRYEHLDAATIEAVKIHFIDTIGCGIAAFDERPVRVCRDIALTTQGGRLHSDRHQPAHLARSRILRQRRGLPLLRPQRHLCEAPGLSSERSHLGMPRDRRGRTRHRRRTHHRDRARLRDQLPADRSDRPLDPRLGPAGVQPAGRGARRRQADEARPRPADAGGQPRHQRPHPDEPDPGADAVRLEGAGRRRSRAQCGVRGAAGARRPHRPGADLRRQCRFLQAGVRAGPRRCRHLRPAGRPVPDHQDAA